MSRRTKLLIAAVFTVLLGIVSVYCVFAWRPVNPLRFRAICFEHDGEPILWKGWRLIIRMEVENTSTVPIYLEYAAVRPAGSGYTHAGAALIHHHTQFAQGERKPVEPLILIPPHRTVVCTALTDPRARRDPALATEGTPVMYICHSSLHVEWKRLSSLLQHYLPDPARGWLPGNEVHWNEAALEVPHSADTAAQPLPTDSQKSPITQRE